jgi:predicted HicB family RNase H-like nuclease
MSNLTNLKIKKTFPLEIEESLHKTLKHKAIELDVSLHTFIIDTLVSRVREEPSIYHVNQKKTGRK